MEFRIIPFVVLLPSFVAVLVEPNVWVILVVVAFLALLFWSASAAPGLRERRRDVVEVSGRSPA